jgi:hypothetical protein
MKSIPIKVSETYKERGIAFSSPLVIIDADGNVTYFEDWEDYCCKREYDAKMVIRFTPIDGYTPFIAEYLKGAETLETRPAR